MPYDENGDWEDLYGDDYDEEYLDSDYDDDEVLEYEQWDDCDEPEDGFRDDVEADADVLRNCGWGTDEDYGYFGDE